MNIMSLRRAVALLVYLIATAAIAVGLGYADWSPWAQALLPIAVLIPGTFLIAPETFGWRDPREHR
jgi:hypothetical protein